MRISFARENARFILLAAFLVLAFLLGGSARDDVTSLILLRPLSVLALGLGLLLSRDRWREHKQLVAIACALPVLSILELIPLPPLVWGSLPGRDLVWHIGEVAGLGQPWRPVSLVPYRTWNSFWSYCAPLAVIFLAVSQSRDQLRKMVYVVAILILASGTLGLLQAIGGHANSFYLYRITNPDSAVGLLANRNHQAMLLAMAFPVFAAAASLSKGPREAVRPKMWLMIGMCILILPFILVTQSRAGIVLSIVGIAAAATVYRDPGVNAQPRRQTLKAGYRWAAIGGMALAIVLTTAIVARASAVSRLFKADASEDLRFQVWGPIAHTAWTYFPIGSGIGTFVEVYKTVEPDRLLSPLYLNHAHNDWLEMLLTGGLPAVAILAWAICLLGRAMYQAATKAMGRSQVDLVLARLGAAIILILALGSAYDYPLRTPSLACLFALAVVWLMGGAPRQRDSLNHR